MENQILTLFYATFQCGRYNVKKKKKMTMKNWKNCPKKLLIICPNPFFPQSSPGHSPQPKIDFPYHEISGPDICSLICALDQDANTHLRSIIDNLRLTINYLPYLLLYTCLQTRYACTWTIKHWFLNFIFGSFYFLNFT